MVLKETLRLYPPVFTVTRRECQAETAQLGEFTLRRGMPASVHIAATHYSPTNWPRPFEFDPERFAKPVPPNIWIPFSAGPHMCIGYKFAMMEMTIAIAVLLHSFEFTLKPSYFYKLSTIAFTLRPEDGLQLLVKPLQQFEQSTINA